MLRFLFLLYLASMVLAACSNPRCAPGEQRIVDTCYPLSTADEDGGVQTDASTIAVAGPDASLQTDAATALDASAVDGVQLEASATEVRVRWPLPIEARTVTAESFRIVRDGQVVPGQVTSTDLESRFAPRGPLPLGALHEVRLGVSIRTARGEFPGATLQFTVREGSWTTIRGENACCVVQLAVSGTGLGTLSWEVRTPTQDGLRFDRYVPGQGLKGSKQTSWVADKNILLATAENGAAAGAWLHNATLNVSGRGFEGEWMTTRFLYGEPLGLTIDQKGAAYVLSSDLDQSARRSLVLREFVPGTMPPASGQPLTPPENTAGASAGGLADLGQTLLAVWQTPGVASTRVPSSIVAMTCKPERREPRVLSNPSHQAQSPFVRADPARYSALAVWEETDMAQQIMASRAIVSGSWSPAVQISHAPISASSPVVALDASGRGLAVWQEALPNGSAIVAARFEQTRGWSEPEMISDPAGGAASEAVLAMERGGNAIVLFKQAGAMTGSVDIVAARFVLESGFDGGKRQTLWKGGKDVSNLSLGMDDAGRALAAWVADGFLWTGRFE